MTITPEDIQLLESERMRDTPDGGGRMTSLAIPSGQAGNVFPKVSRVDSVYGRVNLRKIYTAVRTATLDMYAGAHAIITAPPENDRISCTLFSTDSAFDTRTAARERIESFVVAGPLSRLRVYGDQLIGQRAVLCYQRLDEPLPEIGEVIVLSVEATGYPPAQQFIRIADLDHEVRVFTDSLGEYSVRVLTLGTTTPLKQTFPGAEPVRLSSDPSPTRLRTSTVADSSRYYGLAPLIEPAAATDLTVRLASVYVPLVPSTQRETAISLASVGGAEHFEVAGALARFDGGDLRSGRTPVLFKPGTLRVRYDGTSGTAIDGGDGILRRENFGDAVGTCDYRTGEWSITSLGVAPLSAFVEFVPVATAAQTAHTHEIAITLGTRGAVYSYTLTPAPAPGTLLVDFRALGRWYRLRDDGAGVLVANNPNEGTGSVDYVTGAVVITLGALPDVGSAVVSSWGSPVHYTRRDAGNADAAPTLRLEFGLAQAPVIPGTVTLMYPVGGVSRTLTDPSSNGQLSGTGATGTINYATGEVVVDFSTPPDRAALMLADYTRRAGDELYGGTVASVSGGSFTVPGSAPFRNGGSFRAQLSSNAGEANCYITTGGQVRIRGNRQRRTSAFEGYVHWPDQAIGTFNAATGVVTLGTIAATRATYNPSAGVGNGTWSRPPVSLSVVAVSDILIERDTTAFDPAAIAGEEIDVSALGLTLDLTQTTRDAVVPGSLLLDLTSKTYTDRNGTLVADISIETGAATSAGSIDYSTGLATLRWWADGADVALNVRACLTSYGEYTANTVKFRTPGSPLRPASLFVQATAADGTLITGTADQNGNISGALVRGSVEQTMGVVSVEFGELVAGEWVPRNVLPSTLRFSGVILTNLPLDATRLGLDPVRLPSDGRVAIFRPADVAVLHNTARTTLNNPVTAGATYSAGRANLALLRLEDANGEAIAADRYLVDLAAGTLTMAADWNGAGVAQPLVAVHRIEDMLLVSDVQINGQVSFSAALPRSYPTDGTYLSSALLYGDLQAIVTSLFDQQTWTGVWSDALIGTGAPAQYNDIDYPVEVLNESAVTERWRIQFTSPTAFQVFGENLGQIATGSTGADLAPINAVTGAPYFVLRAAGWGGGWATGNNLRFNTVGANGPTWIARTILAGASLEGDQFDLEARGDVD